jgi:CHAD domain-containing protein
MLPQLPQHKQQRQKALRLLKKLRRAAGRVRDLDVQRQLIREEAAASHGALRKEARHLRRELKRKRDDEAAHLLKLLHKQTANLRPVFEKLLHTLAPAESLALSEAQLTGLAHNLYAHPISGPTPAAHNDTAQLHALRKRAKLARYLAESAPLSAASAHRLAAHFEKLQEAGGKWHDWLLLTNIATGELGHSASLAERFAAHTRSSLRTFKRRLTPPLPGA